MVFVARIRLIALFVLVLSAGSIMIHLWMTKQSSSNLVVNYATFSLPYSSIPQGVSSVRNKKLWGEVNQLTSLKPNSKPRSTFTVPHAQNNGFIYAKVFGGFENIRTSICDLVTISRLLNATLVIPEIQANLRSKGISYKYKSFSYLYDEERFISKLKNDVLIVKSLPSDLKEARKRNVFRTFKPNRNATPSFYLKEVLTKLKKEKVIGLIVTDGGCLESNLPSSMDEFQRLRCRVAFHSLQFRSEIQLLGQKMVQRLKAWGQPVLAYHPGLFRESLAYNGCGELFQDLHTMLVQHRREQMIKQGFLHDDLSVDSRVRRDNGSCPLMPEEVGLLLRAMGYPPKTLIYIAGSETFGGQRVLIPLRSMFPNSVDRTVLCSKQDLTDLIGPEITLPSDSSSIPRVKSDKHSKEEWDRAGPRPRPLPPPPDRPIYQHEKEGWYGWITETADEPSPSLSDFRSQAHRLLWDALDYIVSVEADAFFPGFNNDGSGLPDFSSLVMGQRLYEKASARTYRPDRKTVAGLFKITRDSLYYPPHNWTISIREHLNNSLGSEGFLMQSGSKSSIITHPFPECMCRLPSGHLQDEMRRAQAQILHTAEECPASMYKDQQPATMASEAEITANELEDYADELGELKEANDVFKSDLLASIDRDEEWDPND